MAFKDKTNAKWVPGYSYWYEMKELSCNKEYRLVGVVFTSWHWRKGMMIVLE